MIKPWHLLVILFFLQACKKNNVTEPQIENIKIEIISGNNQWDTIGHILKDSLVVRVTKNNQPIQGVKVKFDKEDCPGNTFSTYSTDHNGHIRYSWQLNGKTGDQPLKLTALDASNLPVDSITAHAEGRYFQNAWQLAYCLPNTGINDICQSGTGRIFVGLLSFDYPYYSDNNGISWQRLTSFPVSNREIRQLVSNGNDIYIATRHYGVYYSSNNGVSWENRSVGITDTREVFKIGLTKSGKLFLSTYFNNLYMSTNKGLSWTTLTNGLDINDHFHSYCETSTGVLYMTSDDAELYRSSDGGNSWIKIHPTVYYNVQSIFVDDNDDLYFGTFNSSNAVIYKSVDNGITWTLKYTAPHVPSSALYVSPFYKVNGTYYFMVRGYGVLSTTDFSNYRLLTNLNSFEYLVTANNAVLVPGPFDGLWYNQNP